MTSRRPIGSTPPRNRAPPFISPRSGLRTLHPFEAVATLAKTSEISRVLWTAPTWKGRDRLLTSLDLSGIKSGIDEKDVLFIAIRPNGPEKEVPPGSLFVNASADLLGHLRWARWSFCRDGGAFGESRTPGVELLGRLDSQRRKPEISVWGYGYFAGEHEEEYRDYFFDYPGGQAGTVPAELKQALPGNIWDDFEPLYWIKIEFDKKVPQQVLRSFEYAATNAIVAINTHLQKQSFYYHGPGAMTLDLQTPAGELHEIALVEDNRGRQYQNVYAFGSGGDPDCRYVPRVDGNHVRLVISPPPRGPLPDRLTVTYKTSSGAAANGIAPGLINSLYTPQPGVESVLNLTETRGGVYARTFDDMIAAFPRVLRSRNRAVVASDFETLALGFDSRIKSATARLGSAARNGVVTRCIELELDLGGFKFVPEEERRLFLARLERYLESRSPMGTAVAARII